MSLRAGVMFFLGIALIIVGSGLLLWVNVQRRAHAGAIKDAAALADSFANLFRELGKLLGPKPAARAGGFMVLVGGLLVLGSFFA